MTLINMVKKARRVYIIGNGGSYANAIHIANDLLSVGIKAYTLDPASLTRTANDIGYGRVFADWLGVVGEPGDLLIALSGSGTSPNILDAIKVAEDKEMMVWKEFGYPRGFDMQTAEEYQIFTGHELLRGLRVS